MSEKDLQVLRALTKAREEHEELAELLDFYYDLYDVQFQVKATLPDPTIRDDLAMRWRLEGGIPQLAFDHLNIVPEEFAQLVDRIRGLLLRYNPNWQFPEADMTPPEVLALAKQSFDKWDTLTAPKLPRGSTDPDELWAHQPAALAVGFALAPYFQRAAEVILPHLDLSLWSEGHCPICGGRPSFAVLEESRGARQLMCSRCNCLWGYPRVGCPFCRSKENQKYYPSEDGIYRLYVCSSCSRYIKTMDQRGVFRPVYLTVERLLTVGMDLAAQQEGFGG